MLSWQTLFHKEILSYPLSKTVLTLMMGPPAGLPSMKLYQVAAFELT
jgi:hypothetical protein